jgi:endonuclease YncB( thermonuclease family)
MVSPARFGESVGRNWPEGGQLQIPDSIDYNAAPESAARRMAWWDTRPNVGRTGTRPIDAQPLIVILALACVVGFYAYQRWHSKPQAPIVGQAWVVDGDTVIIFGTRIRLQGIDAPETSQTCADPVGKAWPCGEAATRELRAHIRGHELTCAPTDFDKYHRVLAVCALADGSDVNAWLVRQGWALAYGYSRTYRSDEADAKAAKRGIWAGTFMPPWEWWRRHSE